MTRALITWGGWMGHEPDKVAEIFRALLTSEGFQVEVYNTLDCFADVDHLKTLDLIVPIWTMSQIDKQLVQNVSEAVSTGTGPCRVPWRNVRRLSRQCAVAIHDRRQLGSRIRAAMEWITPSTCKNTL